MRSGTYPSVIILVAGLLFWESANFALGTQEPWDSPNYGAFYLAALGVSGAFGYGFYERPLRCGPLFMFAQLPVMIYHAGVGPLLLVGIVILAIESVPAMLVAFAGSRIRRFQHRSQPFQ